MRRSFLPQPGVDGIPGVILLFEVRQTAVFSQGDPRVSMCRCHRSPHLLFYGKNQLCLIFHAPIMGKVFLFPYCRIKIRVPGVFIKKEKKKLKKKIPLFTSRIFSEAETRTMISRRPPRKISLDW